MLNPGPFNSFVPKACAAAVVAACFVSSSEAMADSKMTAGTIMAKMSSEQRFSYVSGMVDAFAYARFMADGKKEDGLKCIYAWFYSGTGEGMLQVVQAFERYPEYPPGPVVWALLKKTCGE
jgi:hypothetical protein